MQNILRYLPEEKQITRAWVGLILLVGYFAFYVLINVFATSLGEINDSVILSQDPISLLFTQLITQIIMFVVVAILITYLLLKFDFRHFFLAVNIKEVLLTLIISICSVVVISAVGEWNMELDFGSSDFAKWARKSEDQLKLVTEHITDFQSIQHFLVAILAVAIVPAIAEELVFRGLIQNLFTRVLKNPHLSICITGFVFSAIHLQFFGFLPRMLLGVLFGYLYYWSGKLSIAIIGHFVNNGLALLMLYFAQEGIISLTPEEMEQSAPWPIIVLCGAVCVFLLLKFKKYYQTDV